MTTLTSLLDAPGAPLGASSSPLGAQFNARWGQERRLIERILDETAQGVAVNHTLRLWHRRTEAFLQSSTAEQPVWKDRHGQVWPADVVLELLADLEDRLSSWGPDGPIKASEPLEDATTPPAPDPPS